MKFHFYKLNLPPLPQLQSKELISLAKNNGENAIFTPPRLPPCVLINETILPRSLENILADIQNGKLDQLTILEWIYCLYSKEEWDKKNPSKSQKTAELIWKAAEQNSWLKARLFWLLALTYGRGDKNILAPSLAQSFPSFSPGSEKDQLTIRILNYIIHSKADELAQLSWQKRLTPRVLLDNHQLPQRIPIVEQSLDYVVKQFTTSQTPSENKVKWLLNCFNDMSSKQQLKKVDYLLTQISSAVGSNHPTLVNWICQNYSPYAVGTRWSELSPSAKASLRKWIGAANYGDFEKLVNTILERLSLEDWEQNQLKKRKGFWANYSDRFARLRILLPQSSANILDKNLYLNQDIGILKEDGSSPTEVCIFDFGDWLVVEFFRGPGSETRLFKHNHDIEDKLFKASELSVKGLRRLGGEIHDHVFCWQYFCEKWLRSKQIYPNEGTQYFQGLSKFNKYNPSLGLPEPSAQDQQKRRYKLDRWRRDLENLEQQARWYGMVYQV